MRHIGVVVTRTSWAMVGVIRRMIVVVMMSVVGTIPMVIVVVVEGIAAPIGRVPAPIVPIAITITIVVGVITVAVAIVVWVVPTAKHIGNIAGFNPYLIAHNHNGIECGIVGKSEEVCIAIAVVPIGRWHTVSQ